jgi:hypothetical protein
MKYIFLAFIFILISHWHIGGEHAAFSEKSWRHRWRAKRTIPEQRRSLGNRSSKQTKISSIQIRKIRHLGSQVLAQVGSLNTQKANEISGEIILIRLYWGMSTQALLNQTSVGSGAERWDDSSHYSIARLYIDP